MSLQWANIDNCFENNNYNYNEKNIPHNPDIFLSRNLDINMRNVGNINDILFKPSNDEIHNTNIFNYEEFDFYNKTPFIENKPDIKKTNYYNYRETPKIIENNILPNIQNITKSKLNNKKYILNNKKHTNNIYNNKFKKNTILNNSNISSNIIQYPKTIPTKIKINNKIKRWDIFLYLFLFIFILLTFKN